MGQDPGQSASACLTGRIGDAARAITPVNVSVREGETVWLHFPPEHCRALALTP